MEIVFLLVFLVFVLPLVLSIVALVKASAAREEVAALKRHLTRTAPTPSATPKEPVLTATPPPQEPAPVPKVAVAPIPPPPKPEPEPPPAAPVFTPLPKPHATPVSTEVMFGGKVASFAGIGLLLIGISLLIGYAIKHAWLGPEARIVIGLLCGATLVVLGHVAEVRGRDRLQLLARTLTGGGSAIFYFCVYAAYGIYALIGVKAAGAGLVASAAAALGLAMAYRSQAVAIIGVLGAFLMPVLVGRNDPNTLFLLSYIALINFPVIALGVYRNWQALYNTAFGFTVLYVALLLGNFKMEDGGVLALFSLLYFFQFAALGLIKLHADRDESGRNIDIIRLLLNSLGLLGALYFLLDQLDMNQWTGAAFIIMSLVHVALVRIGWKWRPSFTHDLLALLVGALTFASLALPVQLDGVWVSVGWSIEGVILCWFALRARIPLLQIAAFLLGLLGLMKVLMYDIHLYDSAARLFLNARFVTGLASAVLLGVQGALHKRFAQTEVATTSGMWTFIPGLSVIGILVVFGADIFWTLGTKSEAAWLLSSFVLLGVAVACVVTAGRIGGLASLTRWLLILAPIKMAIDVLIIYGLDGRMYDRVFANVSFVLLLFMVLLLAAGVPALLRRPAINQLGGGDRFSITLNIMALVSGILIVTSEIYRMQSNWDQTIVTIWLATCAISLVVFGLVRRRPAHRYAGLWIFVLATLKVLVIDLDALDGLERIAAFMVVGVLLLILSFLYQRAAAAMVGEEEADT